MWLAFPPANLWPLAFLAPIPLALAVLAIEPARGARRMWLLLLAWAVCALKWWALNAWLSQVTAVGHPALSVYASGFDVLVTWLLLRMRMGLGRWTPLSVLLPLAVCGPECLRSLVVFDGYPWFRAGHPLAEWPVLIQVCDLGGEVLASLVVVCVAGAVLDVLLRWCRSAGHAAQGGARSSGDAPGPAAGWSIALAVFALGGALLYGAYRLGEAPEGSGPGVLAIQTNVPTSNKLAWTPQQQVKDVDSFADLTLEAAIAESRAGHLISLAVWPETMLGGYGLEPEVLAMLEREGYFPGRRFQRMAMLVSAHLGAPLLVGSPCFVGLRDEGGTWKWDRQFNSAYLVGDHAPPYPRYDKRFLAPFGETMPYIRAWPGLQERLLAFGAEGMRFDLESGSAPVLFNVPWLRTDGTQSSVSVAVPICFEDAMSWVCRDLVFPPADGGRVRRANLLVNITNDGWFAWFDGGRAQHVQLARFRCVETRTPMVRVANTGMTASIDSSGRLLGSTPPARTAAWLYANPPLDERVPLFARIGDGVSWLIMSLCAVAAILSFLRSSRRQGGVACLLMAMGCLCVLGAGCANDAGTKPASEQPWSSRSQSVQPTGEARLSEGPPSGPAIPIASSGGPRSTATALLLEAARSPVPVYRANAIEALGSAPEALRLVLKSALADPNRGVRFVAAASVGRAQLTEFADAVQPLLVDESASVRAAAIYALIRLGQKIDPSPLAAMVMSDDPEIRSNAYMVLGELGNPSALPLIKGSLGKGMRKTNPARVRIVELQAAEAMVRLGDSAQIEPIRAALFAPSDQNELNALAAQIAGRLKDEGSRPMLIRLIDATGESARPAEIRLTAAASLTELGPQDFGQVARLAKAYIRDRDPIVRGQAALALARSQGPPAAAELERMLFDTDPNVQLATARAILIATRPR